MPIQLQHLYSTPQLLAGDFLVLLPHYLTYSYAEQHRG